MQIFVKLANNSATRAVSATVNIKSSKTQLTRNILIGFLIKVGLSLTENELMSLGLTTAVSAAHVGI